MKEICGEDACESAEDVGEPVVGIISGATGRKGLPVFVDASKDAEKNHGNQETDVTRRVSTIFEKQPSVKYDSAAEEVSEVCDLVQVGDFRGFLGELGVERGSNTQNGEPQDKEG